MNQSHVIDSWIAELGLSSRRSRGNAEHALSQATANAMRTPACRWTLQKLMDHGTAATTQI